MGYRYRENDRYYGRGPPSRDEDDYYERRGPAPSFAGRDRRSDERRFMREIATKALFLSAKKFYLDIVEGSVGKLLKLSEVSQTGQKSKMLMDLEMAVEFHDKISDFCDFLCTVDKNADRDHGGYRSEPIKNDTMVREQRRYYLDLMENHRGMFLKVTMRSPTTERIQIVFPASGLPEVRDALTELLSEHGSNKRQKYSEGEERGSPRTQNDEGNFDEDYDCDVSLEVTPEDEVVTLELEKNGASERQQTESDQNKLDCRDRSFQFEVKTNETGTYLSITESSAKFRSVINVPQKCWQEFVSGIEEKLNELRSLQAGPEPAENFKGHSDGGQ